MKLTIKKNFLNTVKQKDKYLDSKLKLYFSNISIENIIKQSRIIDLNTLDNILNMIDKNKILISFDVNSIDNKIKITSDISDNYKKVISLYNIFLKYTIN